MELSRFSPTAALAPFVKELLIIESELSADNTLIPDTAVVMAFRFKGRTSIITADHPSIIPVAAITGLRRSARQIHYEKGTANVLVVLREGGIHAFTSVPAHELFGLCMATDNLFRPAELDEVSTRLSEAFDHSERVAIMEGFLLRKLAYSAPDLLVQHAVSFIKQQKGIIRVKELAASLHISQDAFEKRFRVLIGATPKQYASIVRLRALIRQYPSYASLTDASYEAGYFDQSHFIKDFRLFTGKTPRDFFQNARYW
ncbi:helix-turn-helix transcriptional regulator [Chitinophaga agrisoli]|uniref:Helix-turn-helix transcriptional regulator n=1 Tax=Chitinophaga agrisoli TaxID=2607653 RepID=A0A5B2W2X4_9BACT|nr:helix-turn-helix transcriptional regulator [Chitinophaga agrisoli]KAA2245454.1 helix-turn-helix transcriptional regulator [Chitinophaga agrisoli]